jgi:hypothetical protein
MAGLDVLASSILPGEVVSPLDVPSPKKELSPTDFVTMPGPKGSKVALDPTNSAEILAKMQDFINQRTKPKSTLAGIGDALYDASTALYHPDVFRQAQKDAQEKAKETFEMQMQMAQYKAAQAQHEAYVKSNEKLMNGQPTTQAAPTLDQGQTAPVQGQGQPSSPVVSTSSGQTFRFNDLPPEIRASALGQVDYASRQKVIDTWAEKHAEKAQDLSNSLAVEATKSGHSKELEPVKFANSADANTQKLYFIDGKEVMMTPLEYSKRANVPVEQAIQTGKSAVTSVADTKPTVLPAGQGEFKGVAADGNNPGGIKGKTGFIRYDTPQEGVKATADLTARYLAGEGPMKGVPTTVENMTGVWASGDPAKQPPNYVNFVKQELSKAGIKLNPDSTVPNTPEAINALTAARIKFESGKNADKFLPYVGQKTTPEVKTPAAAAPTEAPQGYTEFKQQQEAQKALNQGEQTKTGQEFAAKHAAAIQAAENAPEDLANSKYIRNIITNNPKAFGVLQHPTVLSALGTAISEGINTPGAGYTHVSSVDDAIRKAMPGAQESDIVAAQKAAQKFAELQLNKAKVVLKGQGSVSDNERRLVADMTGNIKNSPAALRDMLTWG